METEEERKRHQEYMRQFRERVEARRRQEAEYFLSKTVKPLMISNGTLAEFVSFIVQAMTILEVSHELREILEEWCDEHDA